MTWTYRVMRHTEDDGETWDAIHEVYGEDGKRGWTSKPVYPASYPDDEMTFSETLARYAKALDKPTIDFKTGMEIEFDRQNKHDTEDKEH